MKALQSILAATDLSDTAGHAVRRAAMLSAGLGARLAITHVISRGTLNALHDLMSPDSSDDLEDTLLKEALDQLHKQADDVRTRYAVEAEVSVSAGSVLKQIDRFAEMIDAGLLVLGAHGSGIVRDLLLGSTTDRVLRKSTRPMLVVRKPPQTDYARVLVPVDFSERSITAIEHARAVAPKAELLLLHAFEVPYEGQLRMAGVEEARVEEIRKSARAEALKQLEELAARAGESGNGVRQLLVQGQAASAIVDQAKKHDCDLIAMGKQGLRMIEELVLGSVTRQVVERGPCDVLVTDRVRK